MERKQERKKRGKKERKNIATHLFNPIFITETNYSTPLQHSSGLGVMTHPSVVWSCHSSF